MNLNKSIKKKETKKVSVTSETELLECLFHSFENGLRNQKSIKPQEYLKSKKLDYSKLAIGFNSGQFHHNQTDEFKAPYIKVGVLKKSSANVNSPKVKAYTCFGSYGIVFPLRNNNNEIVNFHSTRIKLKQQTRSYLNKSGVYPKYPSSLSKRLYIVQDVYEASTLIQSGVLENKDEVLALNESELSHDILTAIKSIKTLETIVIVSKHRDKKIESKIKQITDAKISTVILNLNQTVNSVWVNGDEEDVLELLNNYTVESSENRTDIIEYFKDEIEEKKEEVIKNDLIIHSMNKLTYASNNFKYDVLGDVPKRFDTMKVTLKIQDTDNRLISRERLDLYSQQKIEKFAEKISDSKNINANTIVSDLVKLCELLENHRDELLKNKSDSKKKVTKKLTPSIRKKTVEFLSEKNLINRIDNLLESTGVIGEERSRMLLYVVATTLITDKPLHAIVQASSGSGKSHLVNSILDCVPNDKKINLTRITDSNLYYRDEEELVNKLFVIQDFDAVGDNAMLAFRELQSGAEITNSSVRKNESGSHSTIDNTVRGQFSSIVATTKQNVYFDNQSRSIVIGVDESNYQTEKINEYTSQMYAGLIDKSKEEEAKIFLQGILHLIQNYDVVNKYATQLRLPDTAKMKRRLHHQFHGFIMQITRLHQFQRERDSHGRLVTTIEDIEIAIDLFFDAIILKIDELTSTTRQFFESLKSYIKSDKCNSVRGEFGQKELRRALKLGKTQVFEHIKILLGLEYITIVGGSKNRGYVYEITENDNNKKMRDEIKLELMNQLETITKTNTQTH